MQKKQEQTKDLLQKKEDMYYSLKIANEQAQRELIDIKNKLF
jgi:hypothetical protein